MAGRYALVGGPRTGKTSLSRWVAAITGAPEVLHTDDLVGVLDWSDASAEAATWFDQEGPLVVEGVAVVRALRKWLAAHPEGKPVDLVIHMLEPKVARNKGQEAMAKGVETVFRQIEPELRARGVRIEEG